MQPAKHFLQLKDLAPDEIEYLFERTRAIKTQFKSYQQYWPNTGRSRIARW